MGSPARVTDATGARKGDALQRLLQRCDLPLATDRLDGTAFLNGDAR